MKVESTRIELRIYGMVCVEEVSLLKRELMPLLDESQLAFDVLNGELTFSLDSTNVSRADVLTAINAPDCHGH